MRLIRLILINLRRNLKSPVILMMTFLLPMVVLFGVVGPKSDDPSLGKIGILDKSPGKYSKDLINILSEKYDIKELKGEVEDNYNDLRDKKLGVIYVIDEDFEEFIDNGEMPKVKCYSIEADIGAVLGDNIISDYVNNLLKEGINDGLSTNTVTTIIVDKKYSFYRSTFFTCTAFYCDEAQSHSNTIELIESSRIFRGEIPSRIHR